MNKQMKKIYTKAMKYYNNGNLKKALLYCDKAIGKDINCAPLLSLKGLILYQLGELEGAKNIWTINVNLNEDSASKAYLSSIDRDEKRLRAYQEAEECIRSLNIPEAIALLQKCEESDFNIIKVSKALSSCYLQKGQYLKAEEYIDKVLSLNKEDAEALKSKKAIDSIMGRKRIKSRAILLASIFIFTASISCGLIYKNRSEGLLAKLMKVINPISKEERENHEDMAFEGEKRLTSNEDTAYDGGEEPVSEAITKAFPIEEANRMLELKDYMVLATIYKEYEAMAVTLEQKAIIKEINSLLKDEGIEFFYARGLMLLEQKSYAEALEVFNIALEFGDESYLKSHIIYMLALSYKESGNLLKALESFESYVKLYPEDSYTSEALYNLATLYQSIDDEKSYRYAAIILESYEDSIYYNTKIKQILE